MSNGELNFQEIRKKIYDCEVIPELTVTSILLRLIDVLNRENNVILLTSPIIICGDIHGQLHDLVKLFSVSNGFQQDDMQFETLNKKYLFMGDYVDRGYHSLNTFLFLATLKLEFPHLIWLLRGNHESRQVSHTYGFYNETVANYGHSGIWTLCNDTFDLLPLAALVDSDIFCLHGGLSPSLPLIERISLIDRQNEIPTDGPFADICWSDPDEKIKTFRQNSRGAGFLFGKDQCVAFNRINRLRMVCRSHQLAQEGYHKFFGDEKYTPDWRLITVWSAPDYSYRSGNKASVLHVNDNEITQHQDNNMIVSGPYVINIFDKSSDKKRIPPDTEIPIASSYYFT